MNHMGTRPTPARVGATLLLINNDVPLGMALQRSLQQRGHVVLTATRLAEALAILAFTAVDLILVDVDAPRRDGQRLCAPLREQSLAPIVILSAAGGPEDVAYAFSMGADSYICKPFQLREVECHIQSAMRRTFLAPIPPAESRQTSI